MDAPAPDVLQDRRDRNVARADDNIDTQWCDQRFVRAFVDQGDGALGTMPFGQQRSQDIGFIVIGYRNHGFGSSGVGFFEDFRVQHIAVQNDCFFQQSGNQFGALQVAFNQFCPYPGEFFFQLLGQEQANVSGSENK